ncbi:UNVERIFIED_ORG: hypothetical protein ABIC43_004284 [Variovorax guangxiensis]
MADPQVIECSSACTVTVVHDFNLPVFNLTVEQGAQISGAILWVWAIGWCIRQLVKLVQTSDASSTKESE